MFKKKKKTFKTWPLLPPCGWSSNDLWQVLNRLKYVQKTRSCVESTSELNVMIIVQKFRKVLQNFKSVNSLELLKTFLQVKIRAEMSSWLSGLYVCEIMIRVSGCRGGLLCSSWWLSLTRCFQTYCRSRNVFWSSKPRSLKYLSKS